MHTVTLLKILLSFILVFMIWEVIDTSLESSLFDEWSSLSQIPWMEATLYDFYANAFCIYLWILYKEQRMAKRIMWAVLLVTLGSIGTCLYLLKEMFTLKRDEELKTLLIKQNE